MWYWALVVAAVWAVALKEFWNSSKAKPKKERKLLDDDDCGIDWREEKVDHEIVERWKGWDVLLDNVPVYEARAAAEKLAAADGVELIVDAYDHEDWLGNVAKGLESEPEGGRRCLFCFALRLKKTAEAAKETAGKVMPATLAQFGVPKEEIDQVIGQCLDAFAAKKG